MSDDGKEIGTITMANDRMRAVIDNIELFVEISIIDQPKKQTWIRAVSHYRRGMEALRRHEDFEPHEVMAVQKDLDIYFQDWIHLHGRRGITNYIHMLGTGHMADYLFSVKNLYRHSQQGWENLNHLLKTVFFRRTARGGAGNKCRGDKNRLLPIARWLQRRLLFACGYCYDDIKQVVGNSAIPEGGDNDDDVHGIAIFNH
jgi:hypothetical protein